jgi:hypothetical protein
MNKNEINEIIGKARKVMNVKTRQEKMDFKTKQKTLRQCSKRNGR